MTMRDPPVTLVAGAQRAGDEPAKAEGDGHQGRADLIRVAKANPAS